MELITVPEEMAESDPRKRKVQKSGHRYFNYALINDSSKEVLYYPLEEILSDYAVQKQTQTSSHSTYFTVVDSEEDSELCKTLGKGEPSQSTYLRVDDSGEDPELHKMLCDSSTNTLTETATWWTSVTMKTEDFSGLDQGGGIQDPARSVILRAADSTGASSASVMATDQAKSITPEEKKKKKRRGKQQKKFTGNQREKRRREKQGVSDEYVPDWE